MMCPIMAASPFPIGRLRFTLSDSDGQPLILLHVADVVAVVGRKRPVMATGGGYLEPRIESSITVQYRDSVLRDYNVTETPDQVIALIDDMHAKVAEAHNAAFAGMA